MSRTNAGPGGRRSKPLTPLGKDIGGDQFGGDTDQDRGASNDPLGSPLGGSGKKFDVSDRDTERALAIGGGDAGDDRGKVGSEISSPS